MSKRASHRLPGSWHRHHVGLCPAQAADRGCAHPAGLACPPAPSKQGEGGCWPPPCAACLLATPSTTPRPPHPPPP